MTFRIKTIIILVFSLVLNTSLYSQEPFFSQAYSNPLQLNPSFAGSVGCSRLITSYRNQWPMGGATYVTKTYSYDQHVKWLHGGIGLTVLKDDEGVIYRENHSIFKPSHLYSTIQIGLIYSPTFIIKKKLSIKPSFGITYLSKSLHSQLYFGDMIDRVSGFVYTTQEPYPNQAVQNVDFSGGLLINTKRWNFGTAFYHINEPNTGFAVSEKLTMKSIMHGSYTFSKTDSSDFSVTPSLFFLTQGANKLWMANVNVNYKWLRGGLGLKSVNNVVVLLGFKLKRFNLNYSYEFNPSMVKSNGGAHEVSIACLFRYKKKVTVIENVRDTLNPEKTIEVKKRVIQKRPFNVIPINPTAF